MDSTAPAKNDLAPRVNSAEAEQPWFIKSSSFSLQRYSVNTQKQVHAPTYRSPKELAQTFVFKVIKSSLVV